MTEGNDPLSDMVEDFMNRQPTEQPEAGEGLFVVDKWGQDEHFIPVTRTREEDNQSSPAEPTQISQATMPEVAINPPAPSIAEVIQNRPPVIINRQTEEQAEKAAGLRSNYLDDKVKKINLAELAQEAAEAKRQEKREARRQYLEKFISPLRTFLVDTASEASDGLARLKKAASSMSQANDLWEVYTAQAEGRPIAQIGGIPLPKENQVIDNQAIAEQRATDQERRAERSNRWQNRRTVLRNLMRNRGIPTATK